MKNTKRFDFIAILFTLVFFAFGCSFGNTKAEENINEKPNRIERKNEEKPGQPKKITADISSITGTYERDTEKDGEGFDNSMEITKADDGKLFIYIEGSYIYKMGETQTFKEAEGKGDAVLKGNRAAATLVDEAGKPCRATIIFKDNTADVKIPDTCQFNILLGGVYKKVDSEEKKNEEIDNTENKDLPEIPYEKVMDFVNDFDAHKIGEEFVITGVPTEILNKKDPADEMGNTSYKGLYFLQGVAEDDTPSYTMMTSRAMIENLNKNAEHEPAILRMTAINIESNGKFDVYRMPFVTKIEGLNSDGDVIWTATGAKPAKLKFTH